MYFSYLPLLQTSEKGFPQNVTTSTHSSEEEKCFTCALPAQPCFFFIEEKEWQALRKHQYGRLFQGLQWTNLIAKGIMSVHPYCSFGFKRHSVKTLLSQKPGPVFTCVGYCRFTNCPVRAHVEVTDECTLKATVVFSGGDVCHNTWAREGQCVQMHVSSQQNSYKRNFLGVYTWSLCTSFLKWSLILVAGTMRHPKTC